MYFFLILVEILAEIYVVVSRTASETVFIVVSPNGARTCGPRAETLLFPILSQEGLNSLSCSEFCGDYGNPFLTKFLLGVFS